MTSSSRIGRRSLLVGTSVAALAGSRPVRSQSRPIRVGVLTDLSGPYRDRGGPTSVSAARQAMEDFAAAGNAMPVETALAVFRPEPASASLASFGRKRNGSFEDRHRRKQSFGDRAQWRERAGRLLPANDALQPLCTLE